MQVDLERRSPQGEMSQFASEVLNHATQLMVLFGLKTLESRECKVGLATKRMCVVVPFEKCPYELASAASAIKDSIADILASVGVYGIRVSMDSSEMAQMSSSWRMAADDVLSAVGGQDSCDTEGVAT